MVGCSSKGTVAANEASKDWTQRRDEFVSASQKKLDRIYDDVQGLEKNGKLKDRGDARKAKNEAEDIREDIVDLKKDLNDDAKDVDADDWEKERTNMQSKINELETDYHKLHGLYR